MKNEILKDLILKSGGHKNRDAGVCAMEAVAWLNGEKHSASPSCACPALTAYVQRINDSDAWESDAERTDKLLPLLSRIVGTRDANTVNRSKYLAFHALTWSTVKALNAASGALKKASLNKEADSLLAEVEKLSKFTFKDFNTEAARSAAYSARSAADSAYSAARSAAYSADSAARSAYSAADSAARSAAYSAYSARSAALQAAYSAAYSAADSAAYSAALQAAYSAADSAARSAAYSADSAYSAALQAAYSAADSAAYSAALQAAYSAARSANFDAALKAERRIVLFEQINVLEELLSRWPAKVE